MTRAPDPTEVRALAIRVLHDYRRRDGLTCYAHDENRQRDERHMVATFEEIVAPAMLAFASATEAPPVAGMGEGWEHLRGLLNDTLPDDQSYPDHMPVTCSAGLIRQVIATGDQLPDDMVRLIIAAREVAFGGLFDSNDPDKQAAIRELDQASEAFADRVRWEDEPEDAA